MTLVAGFVLVREVHQEEYDAAETVPGVCGIPALQAQAAGLKDLVEGSQGVTNE
jgi:hypothetical protein